MDSGNFDVLIVGTGLTESITAAALAKAGFKVVHIDNNPYYGGHEAGLSIEEIVQWTDTLAAAGNMKFTSLSRSGNPPSQSRQYSIYLRPAVIPSVGPVISSLISSGVSKYCGFRILEGVGLYHPSGVIKSVPGTREDVFRSKEISLVDKRRLMRFLMFAVGEFEDKAELRDAHDVPFPDFLKTVFSLNDDTILAIVYALAFCISASDATLPALHRIRRYLRSAGRYGPSPFLVGHYGGTGEIAQGFCRAAAVYGGVYILGRQFTLAKHTSPPNLDSKSSSTEKGGQSHDDSRYSITLEDFPDKLTANVIVSSASYVPPHLVHDTYRLPPPTSQNHHDFSIARCIAIIDRAINFPSPASNTVEPELESVDTRAPDTQVLHRHPLDTGMLIFPPSTVEGGSVIAAATVLITGEGTMSTPMGKWVLYISLPLPSSASSSTSAEKLLKPYLDATLALSASHSDSLSSPNPSGGCLPLFTTFYIEHPGPTPVILDPQASLNSGMGPKTYIVPTSLSPALPLPDVLDVAATHAEEVFWEVVKALEANDTNSSSAMNIESFWPSLDAEAESAEEEW